MRCIPVNKHTDPPLIMDNAHQAPVGQVIQVNKHTDPHLIMDNTHQAPVGQVVHVTLTLT